MWVIVETVNVLWPRTGDPWVDWAPFIVTAALFVIGLVIRARLGLKETSQQTPETANA